AWIQDMARLLASPAYGQFRAALQWDDRYTGLMSGTSCDFGNRTSPAALAAWRAMAVAPAFAARSACDLGDCPAAPRRSRLPLALGVAVVAALLMTGVIFFSVHRARS